MKLAVIIAAAFATTSALGQSVDLRGLDTLGGSGSQGQAKVQIKEPSYSSGNSRLDLSNPALGDTLSGAGNRVSGLCGAPEKNGATVTNCYGLVGPSEPLKGDTLK